MNNILKRCLLFFVLIFTMILSSIFVYAADPVYVKLNGVDIVYEDAKPQIMNQRAMVPFRKTAEMLGATVDWNAKTQTATMRKGDRVVVHTMLSRVITVNGKASTFDTPSAVIQSRTMMPVRMLSEALGNAVTWDNATRTVNIIADNPSVISIIPDKTMINSGEKINIAVTTNSRTDRIKILDIQENNKIIAEANTYSTNVDGTRLFSIPWTPSVEKSSFKTLKAVPGNFTTYNENFEDYKVCAVNINAVLNAKLYNFRVNKTLVKRNEPVKFTIEANAATQVVKIENSKNIKPVELTNYTTSSNGEVRIFETELKIDETGEIEFKVFAGNNGNFDTNTLALKVKYEGSSSSSSSSSSNDTLKIKESFILNNQIYVDEDVQLIVRTSSDIDRVEVLDENDNRIEDKTYADVKNSSENIWEFRLKVKNSGRNRYNIKAYNRDGKVVTDSVGFNAESGYSGDLLFLSVLQRDIAAMDGDTVRFDIKTTEHIQKLEVYVDGSKQEELSSSYSGSSKEWTARIKITESNKNRVELVGYDKDDKKITTKVNVFLNTKESGKINGFDLRNREIYIDDYIELKVYTNTAISKVWIEDYNGERLELKSSPDYKDSNQYTWEFRFKPKETGDNIKYYIYAEDKNGKKFDDYFRIRVNK